MMNGHSPLCTMVEHCLIQPDGFIALSDAIPWRLGAALFARNNDAFAAVRKAKVSDGKYEFTGLYALPGGMTRLDPNREERSPSAQELLQGSLADRVSREAGLRRHQLSSLAYSELGPIVTSYTAKGRKRFTLIAFATCEVDRTAELQTTDRSIDETSWMSIPPPWEQFAPGNRIALAHLLWNAIGPAACEQARLSVAEAADQCSEWAMSIGVEPVPAPWADSDHLREWREAWPKS